MPQIDFQPSSSLFFLCVVHYSSLWLPWWLSGKEAACKVGDHRKAGDVCLIPGSGKSPGEGNGNPLQYSCLGNPMDRGAWWATIHGVAGVIHDLATKPQPWPQQSSHCIIILSMPVSPCTVSWSNGWVSSWKIECYINECLKMHFFRWFIWWQYFNFYQPKFCCHCWLQYENSAEVRFPIAT